MKKLPTRPLVLAAAAAVAIALVAIAIGSLRWRPARRAEAPRLGEVSRGAGPLLGGAAELPLSIEGHVPVAGFPRLSWMDQGLRDPVAVRALVLSEPGCTVGLVSLEILLVPGKLERAIERRVRDLKLDQLIVAATHTHSGPGGFWEDALGQRIATGPYDPRIFDQIVDRAVSALRAAAAAREPALLSIGRADAPTFARNRSGARVEAHLVSLRLSTRSGHPLARVVIFPAHATILGIDNRRISGDWPGYLMRAGEQGVTLFFQGAMGDQSPRLPGDPRNGRPESYARALAARVAAIPQSQPDPWPALAVATATTVLPDPVPGAAPSFLKRIATNLFYHLLPERASVRVVRIGGALLLGVPGEPVAEVGRRWREAAGEGAEVVALAGDYLGYIETSERMAEQLGETVRTYYGPELADRLGSALEVAAAAVRDPTPVAKR